VQGLCIVRNPKSPRERAARALCRLALNPENTMHEGKPLWLSYLEEVDTVLAAALTTEEWKKVRAEGPEEKSRRAEF